MAVNKPRTPQDANTARIRSLVGRKDSVREIGRQKVEIPKIDMIREMSRTPEGRAALKSMFDGMEPAAKENLFEALVKGFKDPTGKNFLNIEGREILAALKGKSPSDADAAIAADKSAIQADDAEEGTRTRRFKSQSKKKEIEAEYDEDTGIEPTELTRYPRQPLPEGFDPKAKNIADPNTDVATSSISDKPSLRSETSVEWVQMPDGTRKPVVSTDGRLSDADYAQRAEQGKFDKNWDERWLAWEQGGKEGPMPKRQKVQPLSDNKARGSQTSPQEIYDRKFLSWMDGKKASNVLQSTISKDDELMEMYLMLRAAKDKSFALSPNATFSSPRQMAAVLLRNMSEQSLANRFNPATAGEIRGLATELMTENEALKLEGRPPKGTARDASELADKRGVPRGSVKTQQYAASQVLDALERKLRERFGDHWGSSHTEVGVPDNIRTAEPAPASDPAGPVGEGTTQDPSRVPGIADVAPRPESTWQGPLAPSPLTEHLDKIGAGKKSGGISVHPAEPEAAETGWFGDKPRTVMPKTDLHGMMKGQLAEARTPLEGPKKEAQDGPANWGPDSLQPMPGRDKATVEGRIAGRKEAEAEKYNEFVDESGKVNTRRSAREVAAELQSKLDSDASDTEIAALKEELRQAKILDSLVSPFGKKAPRSNGAQIGTPDGPAVSTKGRQGQQAEPDPFDELADEMAADRAPQAQARSIEDELADARIAAGIDPADARPKPQPPVDDAIDPLESAATPIDDPETAAAKNADAKEAPEDVESARPAEEAKTIPEDAGSVDTPKDKAVDQPVPEKKGTKTAPKKGSVGRYAGWGTAATALGLPAIFATRSQMFQDREIPAAWGEEAARPEMEQMPVDVPVEMGEDASVAFDSPFRPTDNFSGPMSPADRIRLIQKMGSLRPNPHTQTAQNWSR